MSTSSSHYFSGLMLPMRRRGIDPEIVLKQIGLHECEVTDPLWRGGVDKLAALLQVCCHTMDDEFFGFTEHRSRYGTFAMMMHAVIGELTVERAIKRGALFYDLITQDLAMSMKRQDDSMHLVLSLARPELDPDLYFTELWISNWYRMATWLAGDTSIVRRAGFPRRARVTYEADLRASFLCPLDLDAAEPFVAFDATALRVPICRSIAELKRLLTAAPLTFITPPSDQGIYTHRVRTMLGLGGTPLHMADVTRMARQLNISAQTLRRRLKQENTSFRMIKEDLRRQIALRELLVGRKTIAQISELLGYSETRAFTRAFHDWFGQSPLDYRKQLRSQLALTETGMRTLDDLAGPSR